jgi:hypothetical protein
MVFAYAPPPVSELGNSGGFTFYIKDNAGLGHERLLAARNQFLGLAAQSKLLANVRPNGQEDTPQFRIRIDVAKAAALGLDMAQVNNTLSVAWGGQYIDDFIDRGRVKRVMMQSDAPYRMAPEDFNKWSVRNAKGEMVPFSAFATTSWEFGSPRLERYNGAPAMNINGQAKDGVGSGDAMAEVERLVSQLPAGIGNGVDWHFVPRTRGRAQTPLLYSLSLLVVFLCLAALYESWSVPTAALLVVPLGILGTVFATTFRGMERDVYFQVAMLTTVGLSSKNAILIIQFAKQHYDEGMAIVEARVGGRARPPASDHHDFASVWIGRIAARHRHWRRLRRAAGGRHRRAGRHGRRHRTRHLLHSPVLRIDHQARGASGRPEGQPVATRRSDRTCLRNSQRYLSRSPSRAARPLEPPLPEAKPDVPTAWATGAASQTGAIAADIGWRDFFADDGLENLIARALENNRDLRVATLNVERARELYRVQRAEQLPFVSGRAGMALTGDSPRTESYSASVGVSGFELDLFGRVAQPFGSRVAPILRYRVGTTRGTPLADRRGRERMAHPRSRPRVAAGLAGDPRHPGGEL